MNDRYVDPTEQLVVEVIVRDLNRAITFYGRLGFRVMRKEQRFAELSWEEHRFLLDELPNLPPPPDLPQANMRVMVARVDDYWKLAQETGARVVVPIADRDYGLRDFTITDPDGFGIRFASPV